jgi:hypothetical protein
MVDQKHSSGDTVAKIPEIRNYMRGLKKTWWVYLYFSVIKFGIRYVVYLL